MDPIRQLKLTALQKRDAAIQVARTEYLVTVRELNTLRRKLKLGPRGRQRILHNDVRGATDECRELTAAGTARLVMSEGKAMSLAELTLEVQRRGCRTHDDPRAVLKAIRAVLYYHRDTYRQRESDKRWVVR